MNVSNVGEIQTFSPDDDRLGKLLHTSSLLTSGQFNQIDKTWLAKQTTEWANSFKLEVEKNLVGLITNMLGYRYNPDCRKNGIVSKILGLKSQLVKLFEEKTLYCYAVDNLDLFYQRGLNSVTVFTDIENVTLPTNCEWTLEQLIDLDYFPDENLVAPISNKVRLFFDPDDTGLLLEAAKGFQAGEEKPFDIEWFEDQIYSWIRGYQTEAKSILWDLISNLLTVQYQTNNDFKKAELHYLTEKYRKNLLTLVKDETLYHYLVDQLQDCYVSVIKQFIGKGNLSSGIQPNNCPWTLEQILTENFLPRGF